MQSLNIEAFLIFFVTHAQSIVMALLLFLFCMLMVSQWRERAQIKQMQDFLSPTQHDILMSPPRLKVRTIGTEKLAEQPTEKHVRDAAMTSATPRLSANAKVADLQAKYPSFDAEFEALRREVDARKKD